MSSALLLTWLIILLGVVPVGLTGFLLGWIYGSASMYREWKEADDHEKQFAQDNEEES